MGKETGGLTTAVFAGGRICTSTRRTRKQKDALDGRDASHTVLSGHSLLDQGTAAGALQQPVVLSRPRRWRGARGIDEVSTRGSHGACLAAAELEERLSSAGFASSQLLRRARIAARYSSPPSQRLAAGCQSEKGLKRKGTRD